MARSSIQILLIWQIVLVLTWINVKELIIFCLFKDIFKVVNLTNSALSYQLLTWRKIFFSFKISSLQCSNELSSLHTKVSE